MKSIAFIRKEIAFNLFGDSYSSRPIYVKVTG